MNQKKKKTNLPTLNTASYWSVMHLLVVLMIFKLFIKSRGMGSSQPIPMFLNDDKSHGIISVILSLSDLDPFSESSHQLVPTVSQDTFAFCLRGPLWSGWHNPLFETGSFDFGYASIHLPTLNVLIICHFPDHFQYRRVILFLFHSKVFSAYFCLRFLNRWI